MTNQTFEIAVVSSRNAGQRLSSNDSSCRDAQKEGALQNSPEEGAVQGRVLRPCHMLPDMCPVTRHVQKGLVWSPCCSRVTAAHVTKTLARAGIWQGAVGGSTER